MNVYEDEYMLVTNSFFLGWRVIDKRFGIKVVPSQPLRDRVNLIWPRIRRNKKINWGPGHQFGERALFRLFGANSLDPKSEAAIWFAGCPIEALEQELILIAQAYIRDFENGY